MLGLATHMPMISADFYTAECMYTFAVDDELMFILSHHHQKENLETQHRQFHIASNHRPAGYCGNGRS